MPHPFFDALSFNWKRSEAAQLYDALVEVIPDSDEILVLYTLAGGNQAAVLTKQAATVLWHEVLCKIGQAQKVEALCKRLKEHKRLEDNAQYHAAIDAVVNARAEVELQMYGPNVLVLDREPLRDNLTRLIDAKGLLRVVMVNGPSKSGKSWTKHVFEAAARDSGAAFCYVYGGMVTKVGHLIDELFAAMGAPCKSDLGASTDNASYGDVCRELQRVAIAQKQPLWIAIDDVHDFDDNIRELCDQIGARMRGQPFATWFRLMLIDYPDDRPTPTTWTPDIYVQDVMSADSIQQEHVEAFLRALPGEDGIRLLDADVTRIACEVIEAADAAPPEDGPIVPRLQRMHDGLVAALKAPR